jgi:uncharacterized protein (TIGR03663 family)
LPALFGIALVGLVWLLREELGLGAMLCAAVLTAVSPAMIFFSRYCIHEMLLVCFTFGAIVALWRWRREVVWCDDQDAQCGRWSRLRQGLWLVLLGLCIGMMHASKETCVFALFAMLVAAVAIPDFRRLGVRRLACSGLIVLLSAAGISALFFSSFLRNPEGVIHSLTTYFHYLGQASGEGSVGRHVYPWDYYLRILFWWPGQGRMIWSEASIAVLALVGLVAGFLGKGLGPTRPSMARFLGVYTLVLILAYSAVPYKTPWCALSFLHGMILLGGLGAAVLLRVAPGYVGKALVAVLLLAATGHLAWEAWQASFVAYEDPRNPYVYSHTTNDIPRLAQRVAEIAAAHPDAQNMHIQVICPDSDFWPLPWYLRRFHRVGWFDEMPKGPAAPLIIAWPTMEKSLRRYLYVKQPPGHRPLYVPVPANDGGDDWWLRPYVPIRAYAQLNLWNRYLANQADQAAAAE